MSKYLTYFCFISSLIANEFAYLDENYSEAEVLFKKAWQKEGKLKDFKFYLKSLIKQKKYKNAIDIIQVSRINDPYINYLQNYCKLALGDLNSLENDIQNQELIDYVKVKRGEKVSVKDDLSRVLNHEDFKGIEDSFYKLYFLLKDKKIKKINDFINDNYKELRNAKKENEWLVLLETYFYLKANDQIIASDLEDFITYNCKIPDLRKRAQRNFFGEDKFADYAEKNYKVFSNTSSFNKLIELSTTGRLPSSDLQDLINLNIDNEEGFKFIKAGIDRDPLQFLYLFRTYSKKEYLFYMFVCSLEKENSFEFIYEYKDILLQERDILFPYINYLYNTSNFNHSNIQKLKEFINDDDTELLNAYARLVYPHDRSEALDIWKDNDDSEAKQYLRYDEFNKSNDIQLKKNDFNNKDLDVLLGISNFRKRIYNYSITDYPEDGYLKNQHLFLKAISLANKANFAEAAKVLDPESPNPYTNGKCADFLFLLYGLSGDDKHLDQALEIYQSLPPNKNYDNSLRYKIFTCLKEKNNYEVVRDFVEKHIFSNQLNIKNYYDRRLLYDAYRFFYSLNIISYCDSISNRYEINLK